MRHEPHNNCNRRTPLRQELRKTESMAGEMRREAIMQHNAKEFIAAHPERVAAYAKQQRDINARRQHARMRNKSGAS